MTGAQLHAALRTLGEMWGLGRPLHGSELGRALRLTSKKPGYTVKTWMAEGPSGPAECAILAWLTGKVMPPDPLSVIVTRRQWESGS